MTLLPILALLCVTPIEAPRPVNYGTYLQRPAPHSPRFECSEYVVYTLKGWRRSHIYDRHLRRETQNYVFGPVYFQHPDPCPPIAVDGAL